MAKEPVRKFESGAFRDVDADKLQFTRSLSPIVLIRYVEFIRKHNQTAGGQRSEDNWKKGFTRKSYIESKMRHFMETWLIQDGLKEYLDPELLDGKDLEELIESLCAELFNSMGFLHVLLLEQRKKKLKDNELVILSKKIRKELKKKRIKATRKKIKKQKKKDPVHFWPDGRKSAICGLKAKPTSTWSWTGNKSKATCETCKKSINAIKL